MRSIVRSLLLLAGLLGVGSVETVRADPPVTEHLDFTFEDSIFSDACGFPVYAHLQGTVVFRGTGEAGSNSSKLTVTYTNPATGRSVETRHSNRQTFVLDPATGLLRITTTGSSRLVLPGGETIVSAGRSEEIILLDPDTWEVLFYDITLHGRHESFTEKICELLSS